MSSLAIKLLIMSDNDKLNDEEQTLLREAFYELEKNNRVETYYDFERKCIQINPKFYLGHFQITSGEVMVSDPCYEVGTWCQKKVENVQNGEWNAFVIKSDEGEWGVRVASLVAYVGVEPKDEDFQYREADIGVDSGQAGIFDTSEYFPKTETWYGNCCSHTLSELGAGVLKGGVVSRSGYGDGGYSMYTVEKDDKVVAIKIVFIGDEEDEEE